MAPKARHALVPDAYEIVRRYPEVVLVGATVRAAAESARRAGISVVGLDQFGDQDTRAACRLWAPIDSVVPDEPSSLPERSSDSIDPRSRSIQSAIAKRPIFQVGGLNGMADHTGTRPDWLLAPQSIMNDPSTTDTGHRTNGAGNLDRSVFKRQTEHSDAPAPPTGMPQDDAGAASADPWTDPSWLKTCADAAGVSFPETLSPSEWQDLQDDRPMRSTARRGRWLCKHRYSSGGIGVQWFSGDVGQEQDVQRWIPGRNLGVTFLCDANRCVLLGICRSFITRQFDRPFLYQGSVGPLAVDACTTSQRESLNRLGTEMIRRTCHRGLLNIDVIVQPSGRLFLLEANPRWSGSCEIVERALIDCGLTESLFGDMIATKFGAQIIEDSPHDRRSPRSLYLKRIIYARKPIRFDKTMLPKLSSADYTIHDIPGEGNLIERGWPICTLIRRLDLNEKSPMKSHRALVQSIQNSGSS